jgi:4-hydroxybenzoate polyprenyltransferase
MKALAYLKLFRFPLVFTAVADGVAGYLLITRGFSSANPLGILLVATASAGLYCFGMAMNDIADLERDRERYPNRVLPSGRLTVREASRAAIAALLVSLVAAAVGPGGSVYVRVVVWAVVAGAIVAYDYFLKFPPVMGVIRAFNFLLGVAASPGAKTLRDLGTFPELPHFAAMTFVYVTALTFVSTLEDKKFSKTGVIVGAAVMAIAAAWPALLAFAISGDRSEARWLVLAILAGGLAYRAKKAEDRAGVMLLVRDGVGGIILLDAIYLLSSGSHDEGLAVATLVLPAAAAVALFKKLP